MVHVLLPPATKLGQGYIFTGVCHSVNRGGPGPGEVSALGCLVPGGLVLGGVWSWGVVSALGGVCSREGVWSPGWLVPGGSAPRGVCLVDTPWDGRCCGRYASYWNAFLLVLELLTYHRFSSKPFGLFLDIKIFFCKFKNRSSQYLSQNICRTVNGTK